MNDIFATKPKTLTQTEAIEKALEVTKTLLENDVNVTLVNKRDSKQYVLTSVKSCDVVCVLVKEFELDWLNGMRFARMTISYE